MSSVSGLMTVAYDPDKLSLQNINVHGDYASINTTQDGKVTFAYADLEGFGAGDDVATLTFTRNGEAAADGSFTITHEQVDNVKPAYVETRAVCPSASFEDLDVTMWYHEATDFVIETGLMEGIGGNRFAPDGKLTRAQMVTVLYRLAGSPSVEGMSHPFKDVAPNAWYAEAITWAYSAKVVKGMSDTAFAPDRDISREQIALILFRYSGDEKVEQDALENYTDASAINGYAVDAMNWAVANGYIKGLSQTTLAPTASAIRAQIAMILMRFCEN